MRIASREKTPGRTHEAAGKSYTFNPAEGTTEPMIAVVEDPAAQAIFLHERNANLFYAVDPVASNLTRLVRPAAPTPTFTVLNQSAADTVAAIETMGDVDFAALLAAEKAGKGRRTVLTAIEARIKAQATSENAEVVDQAKLILANEAVVVIDIIGSITDHAILAEAKQQEGAGQHRADVLAAINAKLG